MALTTNTAYKTYAGITASTWDTLLTTLIAAAQGAIEIYCGRPAGGFESATWMQARSGNGAESIWVQCWPVTAITSVTEIQSNGSTYALNSTTYRIGDRGEIARTGVSRARFSGMAVGPGYWPEDRDNANGPFGPAPCFVDGRNNYSIVYTGGYSAGSIPASLVLAVWLMVDNMFARRGKDAALSQESIEGYSYTKVQNMMSDLMTPNIKLLLREWGPP